MKLYILSASFSTGGRGNIDQGKDSEDNKKCPLQLAPNIKLPGIKCSAPSYDCSQITCSARFSHEDIKLTMKIDQWKVPISAYVTFSVTELEFDWSHSFVDGDKWEVPGFPLEIEGFLGADVFLQLSLKKGNGTIDFKVRLP